MRPSRRGAAVRAGRVVAAVVLLLAGIASLALWWVLSGNEDLPYDGGATPPSSVHVTADKSYSLAVPGGVPAMQAHGVPVTASTSGTQVIDLQCTVTAPGYNAVALAVAAEALGTKAENTVGHFTAPFTGRIRVNCAGWGAMFVPDGDDRPTDWAGAAIVVSIVTLTIGAGLALAELRRARERSGVAGDDDPYLATDDAVVPSPHGTGEHDEIE